MINIDVKVNVKVTNGTFTKKGEKQKFSHIFAKYFVMFLEYTYESFDMFTKIITAFIENYIIVVGVIDV